MCLALLRLIRIVPFLVVPNELVSRVYTLDNKVESAKGLYLYIFLSVFSSDNEDTESMLFFLSFYLYTAPLSC